MRVFESRSFKDSGRKSRKVSKTQIVVYFKNKKEKKKKKLQNRSEHKNSYIEEG